MGLNSSGLRIRAILFYTFAIDMKKLWRLFVFIPVIAAGCEKAINFNLEETEPKLVVEAIIENNQPPQVILSQSLNYFSNIDTQLLAAGFVHNAEVYISNGLRTHKLKEYLYVANGYKLYYYSIDSTALNSPFVGELNKQYFLRIFYQAKEYTATTTIPNITKKVDSLWWKPAPATNDTNKVVAMVRASDPAGFGDYVRYFTKRNNEPFYPAIASVFDDLVIDGTTYELQIDPGINRNLERKEEEHFFNRGDTVTFKLCNIDRATFDFWRTMEYSYSSIGNPFATPVKVLGNVSNGALGYFGGYACQYHTLVIPK